SPGHVRAALQLEVDLDRLTDLRRDGFHRWRILVAKRMDEVAARSYAAEPVTSVRIGRGLRYGRVAAKPIAAGDNAHAFDRFARDRVNYTAGHDGGPAHFPSNFGCAGPE